VNVEPAAVVEVAQDENGTPLTESSPTFDFSQETWVGVFPGLGAISVDIGGDIAVSPHGGSDEDPQLVAQRERALRWGWADSWSWLRRDYQLINGVAIGHPDEETCMVVLGDYGDCNRLVIRLIANGWRFISDRSTPVRWDTDGLYAQPREAPLLLSRHRAIEAKLEHRSVRSDSDTVEVDVSRIDEERKVAAFVSVGRRRPFESSLELLSGHDAFRFASGLLLSASSFVPHQGDDAPMASELANKNLAQSLRLVKIPAVRLRRTPGDSNTSAGELLKWWAERGSQA
jgi:hypothetical protein